MNFFMLMPVPPILPSTVTITNVTPDGSVQFQASNSFPSMSVPRLPLTWAVSRCS